MRIAVHAGGLNFRDVFMALGLLPGGAAIGIGSEGAGVVLEVGEGVEDLAPGRPRDGSDARRRLGRSR